MDFTGSLREMNQQKRVNKIPDFSTQGNNSHVHPEKWKNGNFFAAPLRITGTGCFVGSWLL